MRPGSALPLLAHETETLADANAALQADLTWRVFPGTGKTHSSFTDFQGTQSVVNGDAQRVRVRISHSPAGSHQEIVLPAQQRPASVSISGKPSQERAVGSMSGEGWTYDAAAHTLHVFAEGDVDLALVH